MNEGLQLLKIALNAIAPIGDDDWKAFSNVWDTCSAGRKEQLTSAGDVEKHLYFVLDGVQRVYYFDEQGREATIVFTYAPSFGGVVDSFLLQQPSRYFYETLTASTFLRASFADLEVVLESRPILAILLKGTAGVLSGVLERLVELQCFSSEEKFRSLLRRSPHILNLVPHKYLANYIGIDPSNFSKFINKIKI
ncbi:Crp/Fnr family transcriptional regulator [Pedobacter sp. SYSU D00535]|uniref:Crp/Fnr family transcriptional regulator n=1 Tax=Pedobacter sp. SYSU D00535 TaxID=2810308 RepID=UPI001A95D5DC|nr:Crp/Fnr family transcriptional regulator [Pedobacter sp. SYSU D00535]